MRYLIEESQTIATPAISDILLAEAYDKKKKKRKSYREEYGSGRIIVQISSIHEGITKNYNKYTSEALRGAVPSWLVPYPKPILLNHDLNAEPLGRMINSEYVEGTDMSPGFIQLRAAIMDPVAAAKVIDGRYLTGSVGGIPESAVCSICGTDIIAASKNGTKCDHVRGRTYDEKVCVYEHRGISFHEYSFVNVPGDSESQVQSHVAESELAEMSVYNVNFDDQTVKEYRAEDGLVDIREMMSEAQAEETYMHLAFGTKTADIAQPPEQVVKSPSEQESEQNTKNMSFEGNISTIEEESGEADLEQGHMTDQNKVDDIVEKDEEDVLDVTDRLTADLAKESEDVAEETEETEEVAEEAAEEPAAEPVAEEQEPEQDEAVQEEDETPAEDKAEESEEPAEEVTEEVAETDEETDKVEEGEQAEDQPAAEEADAAEEVAEEEAPAEAEEADDKADSEEATQDLQARVDELEAENEKLRAQNKKMKDAIHAELAEKVVNARIAVGHLAEDDREAALEEHKARSASSLADALVDIRAFAEKNSYQVTVVNGTVPSLEIKAQATSDDSDAVLTESEDGEVVEQEAAVDPEEVFVEQFSQLLSKGVEKTLSR